MEIDDELAQRMQRVRDREFEIQREREEVRYFARQEYANVEAQIDELKEKIEALEIKRDQLADFLGIALSENSQDRLAHGVLKELCFEALNSNPDGLRSHEVKSWISGRHPNIKVSSVPATLSRQMEQGMLTRDGLGKYYLVKRI